MPPLDMKGDWNRRARENAEFYIATSVDEGEESFVESGRRDVGLFFDGLEALLTPQRTVVDVGCGIGRMDQHVAPRVGKLIGIDVAEEMVARARARLAEVPNVEYLAGDGWTLQPLADDSIDLVFSHIVFQHTPRKVTRSYFDDIARVLRPGGDFVYQMPGWNERAPADPPEDDTFEMRFWKEEDLRHEMESRGFTWLECRRFAVHTERLDFDQLRIHVRHGDA